MSANPPVPDRPDAASDGTRDYRQQVSWLPTRRWLNRMARSGMGVWIAVDLRPLLPCSAMHFDLTDEETSALLNLLTETIENDRYPLSPRVQTLRGILAKFGPIAPAPPPPVRPPTPDERDPSRWPRSRSRRR